MAGCKAIVPQITGRAWSTGEHSRDLDPTDPCPQSYVLSDMWGMSTSMKLQRDRRCRRTGQTYQPSVTSAAVSRIGARAKSSCRVNLFRLPGGLPRSFHAI
nr:proline racemase family protein [Mesorhizobium sp.]